MKLLTTFSTTEHHTVERELTRAQAREFKRQIKDGDPGHWIETEFYDDALSDSDCETVDHSLYGWEFPSKKKQPSVNSAPL